MLCRHRLPMEVERLPCSRGQVAQGVQMAAEHLQYLRHFPVPAVFAAAVKFLTRSQKMRTIRSTNSCSHIAL